MATKRVDVRIGTGGVPVGELVYEKVGNRETAAFRYYDEWLSYRHGFDIAPDMPRQSAPSYYSKAGNASALPGPIADGAPDSWGRAIIKASLGGRVESDLDYLLEADDELRSGALRYFTRSGDAGRPLAASRGKGGVSIPRLLDLEQVVAESRAFEEDPERYREKRANLLHGGLLKDAVGSLGGARPKVNARDEDGNLWIVKLAKMDDTYAVGSAEVLALRLAGRVGINASMADLIPTSQRFPVAIIRRFDRIPRPDGQPPGRVPFISAQTFMGLRGTESGNYVDIVQRMLTFCTNPRDNARELFRRVLFNILIQNTDDHLRNHGFLLAEGKWTLAPAYDLNPVPGASHLQTAISDIHGNELSLANLLDAAVFFEMKEAEARDVARRMASTISSEWRQITATLRMSSKDIHAIAPAMDSPQVKDALAL